MTHTSPDCFNEVKELRSHYYPIELDPTLSVQEKTPHMAEVFLLIIINASLYYFSAFCSGTPKLTWPLGSAK